MLKTVLAAALLHGAFTVGLPIAILRWTGDSPLLATGIGPLRWPGVALIAFGAYLYFSCAGHLLRSDTSAIPPLPGSRCWECCARHPWSTSIDPSSRRMGKLMW